MRIALTMTLGISGTCYTMLTHRFRGRVSFARRNFSFHSIFCSAIPRIVIFFCIVFIRQKIALPSRINVMQCEHSLVGSQNFNMTTYRHDVNRCAYLARNFELNNVNDNDIVNSHTIFEYSLCGVSACMYGTCVGCRRL